MISKKNFDVQTDAKKFIRVRDIIDSNNKNNNNVKMLNNFNKTEMENFEFNSRMGPAVLYVDSKCFVINNRDFTEANHKEYKNNSRMGQTRSGPGSTSKIHILVCPIKKIYNAVTLTKDDNELLKHMNKVGRAVGRAYAKKCEMKFGKPVEPETMTPSAFQKHKDMFAMYKSSEWNSSVVNNSNLRKNYNKKANLRIGPFESMRNSMGRKAYGSSLAFGTKKNLHLFGSKFDRIKKELDLFNALANLKTNERERVFNRLNNNNKNRIKAESRSKRGNKNTAVKQQLGLV